MRTSPSISGLVFVLALPIGAPTIAQKSQSKPAESKSCDGRVVLDKIWRQIRKLHDKNGDGEISKQEFTRGEKQFRNHDRNRDGVISSADYPEGRSWNGFGPGIAGRADFDKDKRITKKEWQKFIDSIDADKDGEMTMKEFGSVMPPEITRKPALVWLMLDQNGNKKIETDDFHSLFKDLDWNDDGILEGRELARNEFLGTRGRRGKVPKVGTVAPDFDLLLVGQPKATVKLSSFRGKRPVALIFGSYT